jgi:glycosyltransferase involved in cell wall biosynthesis
MAKISAVIPLYNKGPHILRAIESMRTQTVPPDEIIVVDDGSTDGGGEIAAALRDYRIRLIRQINQGESAARNRGIDEAQGELIAFLDADDAWKPRFLETIHRLRARYPEAGAYGTAYDIITPAGDTLLPNFQVLAGDEKEGLIPNYVKTGLGGFLGLAHPLGASSVAIPRKIFAITGGFPALPQYRNDIDMFLRIALFFPIAWSAEPLAVWYQNAVNRHFGVARARCEPAVSRTIRQALQSPKISGDMKRDLFEYGARFQVDAARDCLVLGQRDTALQLLSHARGTELFAREWRRCRLLATLPGRTAHYVWKLKKHLESHLLKRT